MGAVGVLPVLLMNPVPGVRVAEPRRPTALVFPGGEAAIVVEVKMGNHHVRHILRRQTDRP